MSSGIYQAAQVDSEMKRNETLQGVKDVPRKQQLHFFSFKFCLLRKFDVCSFLHL
jgi:hypothetical protein